MMQLRLVHWRTVLRTASWFSLLVAMFVSVPVGAAYARFRILHSFAGTGDGATPQAPLLRDSGGNLYGATQRGGENQFGTVFKIAPDGTETILHAFNYDDGDGPVAGLISDPAGNLYGTTVYGGAGGVGAVFELTRDGTETVLYSFDSNAGLGWHPSQPLTRDGAGNLYGTTIDGRLEKDQFGTVFRLDTAGMFTCLHKFKGKDGAYPSSPLLLDKAGNLYGTTYDGGQGYGNIFKITPKGAIKNLYEFSFDARFPYGLTFDDAGNLYTTVEGGDDGFGAVFRLATDGTGSLLYSFKGGSDGAHPNAGLIFDKFGNLYGTTTHGGAIACTHRGGCGTVFKIAPDGSETVLHAFAGRQGKFPVAGLAIDKKGSLYGTAPAGGGEGSGSVFQLKP